MNQSHWTFWDHFGRQHIVGILHGIKTGHLVIHLNSRILIIDFNVQKSKTYSFLINEELCELQIEEEGSGFTYGLEVNEEQAAARKQLKQKEEKRFFYQKNRLHSPRLCAGLHPDHSDLLSTILKISPIFSKNRGKLTGQNPTIAAAKNRQTGSIKR